VGTCISGLVVLKIWKHKTTNAVEPAGFHGHVFCWVSALSSETKMKFLMMPKNTQQKQNMLGWKKWFVNISRKAKQKPYEIWDFPKA